MCAPGNTQTLIAILGLESLKQAKNRFFQAHQQI